MPSLIYVLPYGQMYRHRPQTLNPVVSFSSSKYCSHFFAAKRDARGSSSRKGCPVKALGGQMSTHSWQSPQPSPIGSPVTFSGASVSTVAQRARGPTSGVTRRQLLPIHPSPASCAAILLEKIPHSRSSSTVCEAGTGSAL